MTKTTVIHHSADYDGIFCREIARKFLPDAELIGWDFSDPPVWPTDGITVRPPEGRIYILDLPVDRVLGFSFAERIPHYDWKDYVWIDHHKSAIDSHPKTIPGYRIDGVAACRLAWQWFRNTHKALAMPCPGCGALAHPAKVPCESGKTCPHCGGIHWGSGFCPYTENDEGSSVPPSKQDYVDRKVIEPVAVRLAGEYDIWDKRDPDADTLQYGLRCQDPLGLQWSDLLSVSKGMPATLMQLLDNGTVAECYAKHVDESTCQSRSFLLEWEGLKFLCINSARFNSLFFASRDVPETGHDALLGFCWNGKAWMVSLYHAKHRTELDLSAIAVKYGGGGHRGACGFTCNQLPFLKP